LVKEGFRELRRNFKDAVDQRFMAWLGRAKAEAQELESALKNHKQNNATRTFEVLEASCVQCHGRYRN
jgi:cytochrome c556